MSLTFLEYEKGVNLFVQAMRGTALGATLRKVKATRWAVLVPQSVILEELGLGVVPNEFLKTHTVVFSDDPNNPSFTTLNGLEGSFLKTRDPSSDDRLCDSVVVNLPVAEATSPSIMAPLGGIVLSEKDGDDDKEEQTEGKEPESSSPPMKQQTLHILRQSELEIDPTDGFTIPMYLVSDAIRCKWCNTGDPLETAGGWFMDKRQEPRKQGNPLLAPIEAPGSKAEPTVAVATVSSGSKQQQQQQQQPVTSSKFRFRDFADKMRDPRAMDLLRTMKKFVSEVNKNKYSRDDLPDRVREFLARVFEDLKQNPVWKGRSEQELDHAQEGLEKYVLTKIFDKTFGHPEDKVEDDELTKRLRMLAHHIEPKLLDVDPAVVEHPKWHAAVQELQKLNEYKNPRDKLICTTNCCKLIFTVLKAIEPDKAMSADDFLPCLILLVGKANANQLCANVRFIQDYRNSAKMSSEAGYYFCSLQSAIQFWKTADANSLQISQEALDQMNADLEGMEQPDFSDVAVDEGDEPSYLAPEGRMASLSVISNSPTPPPPPPPPPSKHSDPQIKEDAVEEGLPQPQPTQPPAPLSIDALFESTVSPSPPTLEDAVSPASFSKLRAALCAEPVPPEAVALRNVQSASELLVCQLPVLEREWLRLRRLERSLSSLAPA